MNQRFKLKFDEMRESDPSGDSASDKELSIEDQSYGRESNTRNVCFAWLNGRRLFLNYSYLVSCDYLPEENMITLTWTTHTVILKGFALHILFDELMLHLPRQILCTDPRYNATAEKGKAIVNEIHIMSH